MKRQTHGILIFGFSLQKLLLQLRHDGSGYIRVFSLRCFSPKPSWNPRTGIMRVTTQLLEASRLTMGGTAGFHHDVRGRAIGQTVGERSVVDDASGGIGKGPIEDIPGQVTGKPSGGRFIGHGFDGSVMTESSCGPVQMMNRFSRAHRSLAMSREKSLRSLKAMPLSVPP